VYQNGKRYNENDGLVFTPENYPYKPGRSTVTKKWKWPELNTIDFYVQITTEAKFRHKKVAKLHLWGGAQQRHVEVRTVYFSPQVMQRLLEDLEGAYEGIIECAYDSEETGEWQYIRTRHDKNQANGMTPSFLQMENIADHITKEFLMSNLGQASNSSKTPTKTPLSVGTPVDRTPSSRTPSSSTDTPIDRTPTSVDLSSVESCSPNYNEPVYDNTPPPLTSLSPGSRKRTFSQLEPDQASSSSVAGDPVFNDIPEEEEVINPSPKRVRSL